MIFVINALSSLWRNNRSQNSNLSSGEDAGREAKESRTDLLQYEFNKNQNALILDISQKMYLVSILLIPLEIIWTLLLLLNDSTNVLNLLQIFVFLIIFLWTYKSASSFKKIVIGEGKDIKNLMQALGSMRNLYRFQRWVLIGTLLYFIFELIKDISAFISTTSN